jgi:hypothetical protein
MIIGFIIRPGALVNNVALRGIGPSLAQAGVTQFLPDPTLELRDSNGSPVAFSDDWRENPAQALSLTTHGLAEGDTREAGIFVSLAPGAYTVLLITHDVEEAIYMADRIMVLSPRPATVQASFEVDLPRPRKLSSPAAQALREAILKELGL